MAAIDSFRYARWVRTTNLVLQAVLFLTLFGGLNYLAGNYAWRFDLTRYRRYSLSPETLAYLKELRSPVRIIVTEAGAASPEVHGLLREYAYATEASPDGKITVEYLDINQGRREAEQLGLDQPGLMLLICGENRNELTQEDLYGVEDHRRATFQGEQAITGAILMVSSPERKKIYFLTGHGELRPDDVDSVRGLSTAKAQLIQRNFQVGVLELSATHQIPADASLLIAVAPQSPYSSFEEELLRRYLGASAGRLILFLAPGYSHGLNDLLLDWGAIVDDDIICDTGAENVTEDGDLIIRKFLPHPITQALIDYGIVLRIGASSTVRSDPGRAAGHGVANVALALCSPTAWGEVSYRSRTVPAYDPGVDIRPSPGMDPPDRLAMAVASERVATRDNLPFSVRGGRLVVFGTGDLISNARIENAGALNMLLGAVNWTADRDTELNIPARPIERFQLSLSAGELRNLRYTVLLALPGAVVLLGLAVYWTRRT
jgi:ABC-type uncharacterized transport system involved in gliding motility auxiliary subunit